MAPLAQNVREDPQITPWNNNNNNNNNNTEFEGGRPNFMDGHLIYGSCFI